MSELIFFCTVKYIDKGKNVLHITDLNTCMTNYSYVN